MGIDPGIQRREHRVGATLGRCRYRKLAACETGRGYPEWKSTRESTVGSAGPVRSWGDGGTESWRHARPVAGILNGNPPGNPTAGAPGRCDLRAMPAPNVGGVRGPGCGVAERKTDPGNSTAGAPGLCDLGPMPARKVGCVHARTHGSCVGIDPVIQWRERRVGRCWPDAGTENLGHEGWAMEFLTGKFNGGCAG